MKHGFSVPLSLLFSTSELKAHEYDLLTDEFKNMMFLLEWLDETDRKKEHSMLLEYLDLMDERITVSVRKELSAFVYGK